MTIAVEQTFDIIASDFFLNIEKQVIISVVKCTVELVFS